MKQSWPKILFYSVFLAFLNGCEWRPLYNTCSDGTMGQVQVAFIPGREGQILRGYLLEGLHLFQPSQHPRYVLKVSFSTATRTIGYNPQATGVRTEEEGIVQIELKDQHTQKLLLNEALSGSYAYTVLAQNPHTSAMSHERRALLEYLAQRILSRVAHILKASS